MAGGKRHRAIVWLDRRQIGMIDRVVEWADLEVEAIGMPADDARGAGAGGGMFEGTRFDPETVVIDDPRRLIVDSPDAELLLIASAREGLHTDAELIGLSEGRGWRVFSLEPPTHGLWHRVCFAAPLVESRAFRALEDSLETFGRVAQLHISMRGSDLAGSPRSVLADAALIAHELLGVPDRVDAVRAGDGMYAALLRYSQGAGVTVSVGVRGGGFSREVTVLGDQGVIRLSDEHFLWHGEDELLIDESNFEHGGDGEHRRAAVLAAWLRRRLQPGMKHNDSPRNGTVLAIVEAALLSARTGEPERPDAMERLVVGT